MLIPLDGKVEYHDKNKYPEYKHAEATCERIQRDVGGYFAQLPFVFGTIYCDEEAISKKVPTNETATLILEQPLRGPVVLTPLPKEALANLRKEMKRPPLELKRKQPESVSTEEPKPPKITKLEKPDNTAETKNQSTGDLNPDDMVMVIDARETIELNEVPLPYYCQWKDTNDNEKQLIRHVMAKKQSFKGYRDYNIFPLIADDDRTEEIWDAVDNIPYNKRWTKTLPTAPKKYLFTIVQE